MDSIIKYNLKHFKYILLKKQNFYFIVALFSLLSISFIWINKSKETNLNITQDGCTIPQHGDKCKYVKTHCMEIEGLFNYLTFIYCTMNKYTLIATIIMLFWIVWLFLLFGTSASSFFSPNLTAISNYLRLPESVAGVTLAALGNGAPDVFSTFSSFKANSGGLAIGELIGASLFVTILVVGSISLVSPLKVSKKPFLCDMLFFIGAILCVLILITKRYITATDSTIMLGYYVLYVILIIVNNWRKHVKQSRIENYHTLGFHFPRCEFESDSEEVYLDSDIDLNSDFSESTIESVSSLNSEFIDKMNSSNLHKSIPIKNSRETNKNNEIILSPPSYIIDKTAKNDLIEEESENDDENTPLLNSNKNNESRSYSSNHINMNQEENSHTPPSLVNQKAFKEKLVNTLFPYFKDWHHQSTLNKCINVFCMPFNLVLTLTIPVITPELFKAYQQQVKRAKENPNNSMSQRRSRHHRHHRRQHQQTYQQTNSNDPQTNPSTFLDREREHMEKLKKQQLSRILSESKFRNSSSLSRSTSFEEIDSLVKEGMMKKQQQQHQFIQSKLSKSYTNDNLYLVHSTEPTFNPLKKSQSLNQLMLKKKYNKNSFINDSKGSLYQKALLNNSQKQKEKEEEFNSSSIPPPSLSINKIPIPFTELSPPKFDDSSSKEIPLVPLPTNNVTFKFSPYSEHANSNNSSPTHLSIHNNEAFSELSNITNNNANININTAATTNSIYPSVSVPPVEMNNGGDTISTSPPIKNTLSQRVMSVSSINNYNFSDINEYNSYFMETNNLTLSNSVNGSYYDLNSFNDYSNSYSELNEPLLSNQNSKFNSKNNSDQDPSSTHHNDETPIDISDVWNKWLIVIPTTICPLFITLVLSIDNDIQYYHWILSGICSTVIFILTSLVLKNDYIPSFYCLFSIIGFITGIFWIYVIANEVVAVLQSLGKILRISDSIMGLSLFAMGNSLGDLITNVSIARMGFSKMALGACIGTPLLNIILGLGVSGFILTEKNHKPLPIKIDSNALYFSVIGLLISTIGTLFYIYFNNFRMTRSYGLCAIFIYALIVIIQVIIEISYK